MERQTGISNNIKTIILSVLLVAAIGFIIFLIIPKERQITELEKIGLDNFTTKAMNYMEEVDRTENKDFGIEAVKETLSENGKDRFIAYALEYSYNENDKSSLTAAEIKETIANIFNIELSEEDINNVGISPILLDMRVGHDPINMTYTIDKENYTKRDIAAIPIAKYIQTSMKADGDGYIATYDKYVVKNPYDALNANEGSATGINDYLNGKGKASAIKNIINSNNAESVASKEKETTVKYAVKDGKLLVISVK